MADLTSPTTSSQPNSTRRMLLIAVIGLILLMVGLIATVNFLRQRASSPSPSTSTTTGVKPLPQEADVILSASGFEPKTVTIQAGGAVRWKNTSGAEATVNSDDHPTHQKYKDLNLGTFVEGSTLVHIFEKPGTYTYHDHFNPERTGTVVVE